MGRNRKIRTLSLFTGAGGLDIGFHSAGFEIVACVEISDAYCETLSANMGRGKFFSQSTHIHCQDIRDFDPSPYKSSGIECIIGGPPCQTFSAAGRRAGGVIGTSDSRGTLFRAYCEILAALKPKVFVFENVYGLPGANNGSAWREIINGFSELGYTLHHEVLDAADYGTPQHRERLFIVGTTMGTFRFPLPTHGPDSSSGRSLVSVLDAIKDLQTDDEPYHGGLGGRYGHLLPLVPEGLNYSFFTAEMGHPEPQFAWRSKFHDLLYKVDRHSPCRTIKAQPGKFTGPFHWKNRHFTEQELKRLQSFPDQYKVIGSYSKVVEQIGNSVPPVLSFVLGKSVREQLITKPNRLTFPARPVGFVSTFRKRQRERSQHYKRIAQQAIMSLGVSKRKPRRPANTDEQYLFAYKDLFSGYQIESIEDCHDTDCAVMQVRIISDTSHIDINIQKLRNRKSSETSNITISGLRKYTDPIHSLSAFVQTDNLLDVFVAWKAIERTLIERTRFFSLIDIYGHYANRGDTVTVRSNYSLDLNHPICEALNYFGQSENCGDFSNRINLHNALAVSSRQFQQMVGQLRDYRFDLRTKNTHPIIRDDRVLCTYPFPLLSSKALVLSRAEFFDSDTTPQMALL